jgi:hypothetical protein
MNSKPLLVSTIAVTALSVLLLGRWGVEAPPVPA